MKKTLERFQQTNIDNSIQVPFFCYQDEERRFKEGQPFVLRQVIQCIAKDKHSDQFAMIYRKEHDDYSGFFGGIEEGETPQQACLRELQEEGGFATAEFVKELLYYQCKFYHPGKQRNQYSLCHCLYFEVEQHQQGDIAETEKEILEPVWMTAEEFFAKSNNDTTIYCMKELLGMSQEERPTTEKILF